MCFLETGVLELKDKLLVNQALHSSTLVEDTLTLLLTNQEYGIPGLLREIWITPDGFLTALCDDFKTKQRW
jgi:hypothetical protein